MAILCVHRQQPNWPADPARPRYFKDNYWVETDGPEPTSTEIQTFFAPKVSPEDQRQAAFATQPDRIDLMDRLKTATPAQIDTWIDTNVTNVATARTVLKAIVKLLVTLVRNQS